MILKVKCVSCGKKGRVLILFRYIFSWKWWFFGIMNLEMFRGKRVEYWECDKCRRRIDGK